MSGLRRRNPIQCRKKCLIIVSLKEASVFNLENGFELKLDAAGLIVSIV